MARGGVEVGPGRPVRGLLCGIGGSEKRAAYGVGFAPDTSPQNGCCRATYQDGTTYFTHDDWLGTERVRTDIHGAPCETITSLPYGDGTEKLGQCDAGSRFFTGKERDAETGLDYFGARYYGSNMGRFLSPDEFPGGPVDLFAPDDPSSQALPYANIYNPQSLNKYSYTYNDPLRYTDPDGHCPTCVQEVIEQIAIEHPELVQEALDSVARATAATEQAAGTGWRFLGRTLGVVGMVLFSPVELNRGEQEWIDNQKQQEEQAPEPEAGGAGARQGGGRGGRQARLDEIRQDDKASSADRGWIANEQRQVRTGNRSSVRVPPGKELAHQRGKEARKGYNYKHSNLQDKALHKTQHRIEHKKKPED